MWAFIPAAEVVYANQGATAFGSMGGRDAYRHHGEQHDEGS
jgi:hypothetical protein